MGGIKIENLPPITISSRGPSLCSLSRKDSTDEPGIASSSHQAALQSRYVRDGISLISTTNSTEKKPTYYAVNKISQRVKLSACSSHTEWRGLCAQLIIGRNASQNVSFSYNLNKKLAKSSILYIMMLSIRCQFQISLKQQSTMA